MGKLQTIVIGFIVGTVISSCGNDIQEVKDPVTGKLLTRYEYYKDDSGQIVKNGDYTEWSPEGDKVAELHYKEDSLHGSCIYYMENGEMMLNVYANGKLDGEQIRKTKAGKLIYRENYENGLLNGSQEYYNNNGSMVRSGSYAKGRQAGQWQYNDDKGNKTFALDFKNGVCQQLVGKWSVEGDSATTFTFKTDGTFLFMAPYFTRSIKSAVQGEGSVEIDSFLVLRDAERVRVWEYELFSVEPDELILINHNAQVQESILTLKRN